MTDEQFTDYTIQQFISIDPHAEFVLIPSNGMMNHVKMIDRCRVVLQKSPEFDNLLYRLGNYTAIILHGMHWGQWETPVLKAVPDYVKVAWNLWGGDIYGRKDIRDSFLAPIDKLALRLHELRKFKKEDTGWEIDKQLYQRIDYCLADEQEEFEYVQRYTGNYHMKHLWYAIFSIEKTIGSHMDSRANGRNIWLWNCATLTSNHFDTMAKLVRYGIEDRRVISPLSYSSMWLKNRVSSVGKLIWSKQFHPLISYIPRNEYNELMLSCGTMIMPQRIPQGHGNILTGLWLGMRVYMSETSIAYNFFKRIGTYVYSFESEFKAYRYQPVTDEEMMHNREVLLQWYGYDHIMQSVKDIIIELDR